MNDTISKSNFIEQIVKNDIKTNKHKGKVRTRFPPEPNGYLHIGHAKSICLNFDLAKKFNGTCYLRFDDTNPIKEEQEYIDAIKKDILWLGYQWDEDVKYASSYFETLYKWAIHLIEKGLAYVDEQTAEAISLNRGTLKNPGVNSPHRNRDVKTNIVLFEKMRTGYFDEGAAVLRAKIDMSHPNMNMRDPVIYRILKKSHHQTGDTWCIYPSYDFAHGQEDAIEEITHSLCTLEFADHRPLYDWFIEHLPVSCRPKQYEFAPLNLSYTVTSKRKLKRLIDDNYVDGWDDPRLPTLSGLRRRGVPPQAIRSFCHIIGVTKSEGFVEINMLDFSIREYLNANAPRAMAVLNPLKIIITNLDQNHNEQLKALVHPQNQEMGYRTLSFSNELFIDQDDFKEIKPNKKWKRLFLNGEVRLRSGYVIKCNHVVKSNEGDIIELHCTYDETTLGKDPTDRKVKGVIHWVDAKTAQSAEVRIYEKLFTNETPDAHKEHDFIEFINSNSLAIHKNAKIESNLSQAQPQQVYQFEREGYFCLDEKMTIKKQSLVFNQTISLREGQF